MLDLTYTRDDLALLLEDARLGLVKNDISQIRETLDLFFELLDFLPVFPGVPEQAFQPFARTRPSGNADPVFEHLILFNEERPSIGLRKGPFHRKMKRISSGSGNMPGARNQGIFKAWRSSNSWPNWRWKR